MGRKSGKGIHGRAQDRKHHRSESSKWRLTYEELEKQTGLCLKEQPFWGEMLRDMLLCDSGAVSELCLGDDALEVVYNPDFYLCGSEAQAVSNTKLTYCAISNKTFKNL